jgi:3-oxoadipate enol-lactonase
VQRHLDAFTRHRTAGKLHAITMPTLVLAGGLDPTARPELGRAMADEIPGARFEVLPEESHQPFQETPDQWNGLVSAFWDQVPVRG